MTKSVFLIIALLIALLLVFQVVVAQEATPVDPLNDPAAEEIAQDLVEVTTEAAEATATTAQTFLDRLVQVPQSDIARIMLIMGGIVLLLAGWRVYEFIILIAGFMIGAAVAVSLVVTESILVNIAIMLIGGLIGAALSAFIYPVAVFLIGAWVGIALTGGLATALAITPVSSLALLLGGLIGGIVLVALSFQFLILLSALVGAQMLTLSLGLAAVWTIILTVIGVIVQLGLVRALKYDYPRHPRRINFMRRVTN
jgi:hypothetical protein